MTSSPHDLEPVADRRVLVFAPVGRDADLTRQLLAHASIAAVICPSLAVLSATLQEEDVGALLLTEEAMDDPAFADFRQTLEEQPPWSDVPVILLAGGPSGDMTRRAVDATEGLRNVTLLERPIRLAAVVSSIRAALRSRARQYEVRDLLLALHRSRNEAEGANRLKDEFLATLSHELRTPLNAIIGWTSMLARGQVEAARLPRVFEALDRNAQAQAQLIADVLDVSRIITGKLHLQFSAVDICDVVARAADSIRPGAAAKGVTLAVQDEQPDCVIRGDADRLQQVFWNLLSNAVKFTPSGERIDVTIARHPASITISVADTGTGIPPEFVPFVFDRFRQANQTSTRAYGGLGLGLSIVKHLVELHGGTVAAASDGPGHGARFDVELPADPAASAPVAHASSREETDVKLGGCSVLVVDDDDSTREVVATILERAHATVRLAGSAAEGWQALDEHVPDIFIIDLGMPSEDGFSMIERIRTRTPTVPAVAFSAYADARTRERALAAGFTAFLAKPARSQQLLELVKRLLSEPGGPRRKRRVSGSHVGRGV
jgi:signal transduction histidine kinase/ActR/RegA family two-component response regulator